MTYYNPVEETTIEQITKQVASFEKLVTYFFSLCEQFRDSNTVPINSDRESFYNKYNKDLNAFIKGASLAYSGTHSVMCLSTTHRGIKINQLVLAYGTKIMLSFDKQQGLYFLLRTKDIPLKQSYILKYLVKQRYGILSGLPIHYLNYMELLVKF